MNFNAKWSIKPGPKGSLTLVVEAMKADEDGSRAKFEADLSADDACLLVDALRDALRGRWQ